MARITKALAAGSGKRLLCWGLLAVGWCVVIQSWLQDGVSAEASWRIVPMALLLLNMVAEDYFKQTVDIRKVAVLALLLFYISPKPLYLLALRWGSGCAVFLAFYVGALHYSQKRGGAPQEDSPERLFPALPFLPSFAAALFIDGVCNLAGYVLDTSLLPEMDACLIIAWAFMPRGLCVGVALFAGWYLFHGFRYLRYKEKGYEVVEGIGFGDVLFLPLFTAFFGWMEFSLLYAAALLLHILRYAIFRCYARKGEDRVCP